MLKFCAAITFNGVEEYYINIHRYLTFHGQFHSAAAIVCANKADGRYSNYQHISMTKQIIIFLLTRKQHFCDVTIKFCLLPT